MEMPFDNNSGERYLVSVEVDQIESGDGVVITLNKRACESFAAIFQALSIADDGTHIHIGYDETEPQGPGVRIVRQDAKS